MAWSINTYAGLKVDGPSGNWRLGMFELCRAVNERQGALLQTKTQFFKGDGSEGSDLVFADFLGLKTTGASSKVETNLTRIQSAIVNWANTERFTESAGNTDRYTLATLESAIGTSLTTAPESATDERFWQALRDALDLLIYAHVSANRTGGTQKSKGADFFGDTTTQDAWDYTVGQTPTAGGLHPAEDLFFSMSEAFSNLYFCNIRDIVEDVSVTVADYGGTLHEYWYEFETEESTPGALTGSMDVAIMGTAIAGVESKTEAIGNAGDIVLNDTATFDILASPLPSTVPMATPPNETGIDFTFRLQVVRLYLDLSSVLTDQA